MDMYSGTRNGYLHLYNPKEEGLGTYDYHYINAYRKSNNIKLKNKTDKRYPA